MLKNNNDFPDSRKIKILASSQSIKKLSKDMIDSPTNKICQLFSERLKAVNQQVGRAKAPISSQKKSSELESDDEIIKILMDSGLLIDLLFNRETHQLEDIAAIFDSAKAGDVQICITDRGVRSIWDIAQCFKGKSFANVIVQKVLEKVEVCYLDTDLIEEACSSYSLSSIESAFQISCLKRNNLNAIITSHPELFLGETSDYIKEVGVTVLSPASFHEWMYRSGKVFERNSLIEERIDSIEKNYSRIDAEVDTSDLRIYNLSIEHFEVYATQDEKTRANITFWCYQEKDFVDQIVSSSMGNGPLHALFLAVDKELSKQGFDYEYSVRSITLRSLVPGADSRMLSTVVLVSEGSYYVGNFSHRDSIKSALYAYINALKMISENKAERTGNNLPKYFYQDCMSTTKNKIIHGLIQSGNKNLEGMDFDYISCDFEEFTDINFNHSSLRGMSMENSSLCNVSLQDACMDQGSMKNVGLSGISATNSSWQKFSFDAVSIKEADLFHSNFDSSSLREVDLSFAILNKASFKRSRFIDCDFQGANLDNALMHFCWLHKVNLCRAILTETSFKHSSFWYVSLLSAKLAESDFSNASIDYALFSKSDLAGSSFESANLSKIDLSYSNLQNVDFRDANLSWVNFEGCDLRGAKLKGAKFVNVNLRGAKFDSYVNLESITRRDRIEF